MNLANVVRDFLCMLIFCFIGINHQSVQGILSSNKQTQNNSYFLEGDVLVVPVNSTTEDLKLMSSQIRFAKKNDSPKVRLKWQYV